MKLILAENFHIRQWLYNVLSVFVLICAILYLP